MNPSSQSPVSTKWYKLRGALWGVGALAAAVFGLGIYQVSSRTFTASLTDPNALPKELAVTSKSVNIPLPAELTASGTTTTTIPGSAIDAKTATSVAAIENSLSTSTTDASGKKTTPTTTANNQPTPTNTVATDNNTTATTQAPSSDDSNNAPFQATPTTSAPVDTTPTTVVFNTTTTTQPPATTTTTTRRRGGSPTTITLPNLFGGDN